VLLVVDVVNTFDHDDGEELSASFRERLPAMRQALAAARESGIPVVYVNDAHGRWDGSVSRLVEDTLARGPRDVLEPLLPHDGEAVLLKHRYSGFDHTALDLLLEKLGASRLLIMGAATEGCVVQTAIDAREHGLKVTILADACATTDESLEQVALTYAEQVGGVRIDTGVGALSP